MAENKKLVIMEDDLAMREIMAHKLSLAGFDLKVAEDGAQGYLLVEQEKPDLVVMDLMMPNLNGFEVLERLRSHADTKIANTPVIVLSNSWSKEDILKTQSFNVKDYLIKAYFTPDEILAKINAVLENL